MTHNMTGKCSQCGISATYKSWKKQKRVYSSMAVSILQRCTNRKNFVYRQFRVDITMEQSAGYVPEIFTMETYRRILTSWRQASVSIQKVMSGAVFEISGLKDGVLRVLSITADG